jgi:hypothetical protein
VALLKLSEEIARRAKLERFCTTEHPPRKPIKISSPLLREVSARVAFDLNDLTLLSIAPSDLEPFLFAPEHATALAKETVGHSSLERRPLISAHGSVVVALPTAISAAVRRYLVEAATRVGEIQQLQGAVSEDQFQTLLHIGCTGWELADIENVVVDKTIQIHEFTGRFDLGAYAHIIFVHDALADAAGGGLQGMHRLPSQVDERVRAKKDELASRSDYRRGMTLVVHGGIGRGFAAGFGEAPPNWQHLALSLHDFMLLSWGHDFSALRAWKLSEQEDALRGRGVEISNPNGFLNLYGYAEHQNFELVPPEMSSGFIGLMPDFVAPLRKRLRQTLDQHLALAPSRRAWIEV